jgi:hypothetical protein
MNNNITTLGNNRFLSKTNPQIRRSLNDGGELIDNQEIQKYARHMVDLGIWDQLVLWVHEDLVKTSLSGSFEVVEDIYDISGNLNDATQSTLNNRPKLLDGLSFDGINDNLNITDTNSLTFISGSNDLPFSVNYYIKRNSGTGSGINKASGLSAGEWYATITFFRTVDNTNAAYIGKNATGVSTQPPTNDEWYMYTFTYSGGKSNTSFKIYRNGSNITSEYANSSAGTYSQMRNTTQVGNIGSRGTAQYLSGSLSDIRVFRNKELTQSEITSLWNITKLKYGL